LESGVYKIQKPISTETTSLGTEQNTLREVFDVEREISVALAAERQKADEWLERARREIDQWKTSEIADLRASAAREREAAEKAAREQAAATIARTKSAADRVRSLTDAELAPLIRRQLAALLPGRTP
jgi:flagellar biosynthesis/type III secretory pathway protein FliH